MAPPSQHSPQLSDPISPDQPFESEDCRQRYRRLFKCAPLVAYTLDSQLRTLYISPYCLKVFGYSDTEIQRNHIFWEQHVHPEDRQRVRYKRESRLKDGNSFSLEYRVIHRDRTVRHIINHIIPVLRRHKLYCIDGFVFDITRRKYLEEQVLLTERIKVLNDMSLGVAHKIRNPITSIGGFARLLDRRMAANDPNRPHVEIILKEIARLEETLNKVLDTFKPINLKQAPGNINMILTKVLAQLDHEFYQRGVKLTTNLSAELPELEVDRHLMEQALYSVLKATLHGMDSSGDLAISTTRTHHHVNIEIDGIGLNSQPLADSQLFFPFYREPLFDDGVGMPLSQQIIIEHGGNVFIKNGCAQRVILVITLPIPATFLTG